MKGHGGFQRNLRRAEELAKVHERGGEGQLEGVPQRGPWPQFDFALQSERSEIGEWAGSRGSAELWQMGAGFISKTQTSSETVGKPDVYFDRFGYKADPLGLASLGARQKCRAQAPLQRACIFIRSAGGL